MEWLAANLAPLMFVALVLLLLSGVPVVFGLAAARWPSPGAVCSSA